ncbi:MAG: type II restriction endonuclease [Bacteroidales bacterium]|nr:type II restriction endonuclease [Bacteroidales bacterium]
MAKKITENIFIKTADDLVTSREQTRAGFIVMALEKNYIAVPYIEEAKALKSLANQVKKPKDLLKVRDLSVGLLTASGLSDKALNYLTEEDKTLAIKGLIEEFLEPAGKNFIDELVYRYLLIKGGIDPSGADEHWKTANSALNRIRAGFAKEKLNPQTFFIGAAIESSMAAEIFKQLKTGTINNAANLTIDDQLTSICNWIINL